MTALPCKSLSLQEKLDLLLAFVSISSVGAYSLLSGAFRGQRDAPSLYLHVCYSILRKFAARLTPRQLQWLSPTTEKVYEKWAKSVGEKPITVDIYHDAKGHWIGSPTAKNVLIWYHGGGFALPANIGYFKFWKTLVCETRCAEKDLAVFAVSYTLAPEAQYPLQLRQSVEALRYIIMKTRREPRQILLGGDSAGGNLVVGVLSHLAHKHADIGGLKLDEPLAGTVAIAPWTNLTVDDSRVSPYHGGDIITPQVGKVWSANYLQEAVRDYYTDASNAPPEWFQFLPVKSTLILAGGNEIMLHDIVKFAELVKNVSDSTELFVGAGEAHVAPIYNLYLGVAKPTQQGIKLKSWLTDIL